MGVLLLKKWRKSAIFFVHFCVRRAFWCFFCRGVCGAGLWWWWADFRGIGCRRVRDDGAVGCSVVIVLWV